MGWGDVPRPLMRGGGELKLKCLIDGIQGVAYHGDEGEGRIHGAKISCELAPSGFSLGLRLLCRRKIRVRFLAVLEGRVRGSVPSSYF